METFTPVFSVYMPTHRTHLDNAPDARIFETLTRQFERVKASYADDGGAPRIRF